MKTIQLFLLWMVCIELFAPPLNRTEARPFTTSEKIKFVYELHFEWKHNQIIRIQNTIKKIESNHNYNIVGLSGEYGAYQFMPRTWKRMCTKYFGEVLDITVPHNQDLIAYFYIDNLINKGYSELQIASIWNCGSPNWKGKIGKNYLGVKYNVPNYVRKFSNVYGLSYNKTS